MKRIPIIIIISILFGASITYGAELILGSSVYYDNNESNLSSTTVQDAIDEIYEKCNSEEISEVWEFDYTGTEQIFSISKTGKYKLEVWGASGGNTSNYSGGYGGYSVGKINLTEGDTIYINVGGSGSNSSSGTVAGGYNGGGSCYAQGSYSAKSGSGGGASHIALSSGILSSLSENIDNILIVSSGGGGASEWKFSSESYALYNGGTGGGIEGSKPTGTLGSKWVTSLVTGGTQTSGGVGVSQGVFNAGVVSSKYSGTFGSGASADKSCGDNGAFGGGGAGGGVYGGGVGGVRGGAGGSGYIGNSLLTDKSMYCYNCTESSEESTKTISTTCSSETPTENCSKKGNGYARISLIK